MMPIPSHLKKTFNAQRLFTDRELPQKRFAKALAKPRQTDDYRILNYYGVSGQGKTALCEQFTQTLVNQRNLNPMLGWAKLDFNIEQNRSYPEALLSIRLQLAQQCNIPFPAFDMAFTRNFSFTRKGHSIRDEHPALFKQPNDVLQDIESVAGDLVKEVPGVGLFYKYLKKLSSFTQNWWQRRGKEILSDLESLKEHNLLEALPKYLGADLYDWLFHEKAAKASEQRQLVILIDTYEALWHDKPMKTANNVMSVDAWVRRLAKETPGILYVLLGREKLNWGKDWVGIIEYDLLGGLSSVDSEQFLRQVPIKEDYIRNVIINNSAGLPFYLDLQVVHYENLKNKNIALQISHFGGTEEDILPHFTSHLDEQFHRTLQILSHARFIDRRLTQKIAEEFLGGKGNINFKKLTSYSFWNQEKSVWTMHSLMRDYLQCEQQKDEPELFKHVHHFLFTHYDSQLETLGQVVDINESHYQALLEASYHQQQLDATAFPTWANNRGELFESANALNQVEPLWLKSLEILEEQFGEDHSNVAQPLNNLASLYCKHGDYAKAEPMSERSLRIREKSLGKDHPDVASSLNTLAALYQAQGDYAKAEPVYQRSLKIREKSLGEDHPDIATTLNNLAVLYLTQGYYDKAEPLYQRSLKISKKSLGEDHPDIATTLNNLAELYRAQGEYTKAEPLYHTSLRILEDNLGEHHSDVATLLNNLAMLYYDQGNYAKAKPLYQRSLMILEDSLGEYHPDVAQALNNLANSYQAQGNYAKVEPLYQRSLRIREESLSEHHTLVAQSLNNLAVFYFTQGNYTKAEPLYQRSLRIRKESLGEHHPYFAHSLNNLAVLYQDQGDYAKAEPLYQRSLRIREKSLGEHHPDVATSLNNLAVLYQDQGDYAKAASLFERAIKILTKVFPDGHPKLEEYKSNYANIKS